MSNFITLMEEHLKETKPKAEKGSLSKTGHYVFYILQLIVLVIVSFYLLNNGNYGWTLFCAIPFSIGLTVGTYTRSFGSNRLLKGWGLVLGLLILLAFLLIASGFEGAICILMSLGILFFPALFGVLIGYLIRNSFKIVSVAIMLFLTSSSTVYDKKNDDLVTSTASESITINASKEKIWQTLTHPVRFSSHPNVLFRSGVSYPTEMFLKEEKRHCLFLNCKYNNGNTKLLIEKFDSLKCIRFSMKEEITTMSEMTFYKQISAPHLRGYFKPVYGEFLITEINPNKCKVTATTRYSYKITPSFYWQWWTDYLANSMHKHVLEDIKQISEN